MKQIQAADWIILNTLIYEIYSIEDFNEMRLNFLKKMKMVIDFDDADFYLADPQHPDQIIEGLSLHHTSARRETLDRQNGDTFGLVHAGKCLVCRDSDLMSDEQLEQTSYYQNILTKNNWHHAMKMILAFEGKFLGLVTFYRNIGKADFAYEDVFLADMMKEHMALRLHEQERFDRENREQHTIEEITAQYHLTKQEHRILCLTMKRMSNPEICDRLSISNNTLKKHFLNIYRKMHINSRLELFKMVKGTH
ncbi:helix-turn-helix domain-containing protein [Catenisphaera adipataccumulans]|uniref:DNA-binding CsgD family transcriptional regulator n=1 Tax=Catenisphaera adipataccumulans TaxID=700500 RepID=A0A7W8FUC3_9FIRM|nr:helix-turn-helix transcriptional regulator [Catenisphaera adipataccumulans]MBB5182439.1 DNA-binding CsgD family transcriptional regulator [Catenisphaera adipataccumulans]